MARPRSISDDRLLSAAGTVIGRIGPGFTLAQVAEEAGVSVGSVAGRFGSKHGLLVALSRAGTSRAVARMREVATAAANPREGLRDALVSVYAALGDAATAANHLGQLGVDIADPALRELLGTHHAALETELGELIRRAVENNGRGPEPGRAARVLLALVNGAALDWSVRPRGALVERLAEDIDSTIESWWI